MSNKQLFEEGDPLDGKYDPALDEQLRKLQLDDPGFDAWLKQMYGYNPYLKPDNKVKVKRRSPKRPRRS